MDDYSIDTIIRGKNLTCAVLVDYLTEPIKKGILSIYDESVKLCDESDEPEKYLMTFQEAAKDAQKDMAEMRAKKEQEELEAMGQRIMQFNQSAQQELQRKQMDLMLPIIEKAQEAINAVAKSNSFTYILDSSTGKAVVVFLENGEDIMPLVKAELGIQ